MIKQKKIRLDGGRGEVLIDDFDRIGYLKPHLDALSGALTADGGLVTAFQRSLEYIEAELRFIEYANLLAEKWIPVDTRGGDNLAYTYRMFDKTGKFKIGSPEGDDVPNIDISGAEKTTPIRLLTGGFKYNVQELLNGYQMAKNRPNEPSIMLEAQRANATKTAFDQIIDDIAWMANPTVKDYAGMTGMFYNAYIPAVSAALGGSSAKTTWFNASGVPQKTFDEIIIDLNALVNAVFINTKGVHRADTLLLPIPHYTYLQSTPTNYGGFSGMTILKFFLMNHPEITAIEPLVPALNVTGGASGYGSITSTTDILLAFERNPDVLILEKPRSFSMLPVQERGFNYIVPCWGSCAGVIVRRPLACSMLIGTSANGLGS